jgi:hypothetical protein
VGLLIVDDGSIEPAGDALIPQGSQFAWTRIPGFAEISGISAPCHRPVSHRRAHSM